MPSKKLKNYYKIINTILQNNGFFFKQYNVRHPTPPVTEWQERRKLRRTKSQVGSPRVARGFFFSRVASSFLLWTLAINYRNRPSNLVTTLVAATKRSNTLTREKASP